MSMVCKNAAKRRFSINNAFISLNCSVQLIFSISSFETISFNLECYVAQLKTRKTLQKSDRIQGFSTAFCRSSEKRPVEMEIFSKKLEVSTQFQSRFRLTSPIVPLRLNAVKSYLTWFVPWNMLSVQQQHRKDGEVVFLYVWHKYSYLLIAIAFS